MGGRGGRERKGIEREGKDLGWLAWTDSLVGGHECFFERE